MSDDLRIVPGSRHRSRHQRTHRLFVLTLAQRDQALAEVERLRAALEEIATSYSAAEQMYEPSPEAEQLREIARTALESEER